jgi:hypothetical protein
MSDLTKSDFAALGGAIGNNIVLSGSYFVAT